VLIKITTLSHVSEVVSVIYFSFKSAWAVSYMWLAQELVLKKAYTYWTCLKNKKCLLRCSVLNFYNKNVGHGYPWKRRKGCYICILKNY
jgi:Pyruvate/2-oxoacid:ferredoxin oxidoreductase delta subunit